MLFIAKFRFVLLALLPASGLSGADSVVLKNSDRLSGEIQKLEGGVLLLKTSYAGILKIDWKMVERISTERPCLVEVESGLQFLGPIEKSDAGLLVVTETRAVALEPLRVVRLKPSTDAEPAAEDRLQGNLDVGYSIARGNSSLNQSSLNAGGQYRTSRHQFQAGLSSLFSTQVDAPTTSRHTVGLRYDRFLSPGAFTFVLSDFERDDPRRLNLRTNLGGGLGSKLIRRDRTTLSLLGGFTFVNEHYNLRDEGTPPRSSSGEGLAGFDLQTVTAGRLRLITKFSAHPNFIEHGRYRFVFDTVLRIPVWGRLTWNLNLFDRYDSKPPLAVRRNDYGWISSFGIAF